MSLLDIVTTYADRQVSLARRTSVELARLWGQLDRNNIAASWQALLPQVLASLGAAQATAAASAEVYLSDALDAQGIDAPESGRIQPGAFAGIASDGRPIASLMYHPAVTSLQQIGAGATPARGLAVGRFELDMITRTQVADAGRTAVGAALAARPAVAGYVRMIVGKTCSRCLILAGRRYRWNAGFRRHPRCDCRHIPVRESTPEDVRVNPKAYFDSLTAPEQDSLLGFAGAEAVRNGADIAAVVNARRGMYEAGGKLFTREAAGGRPRIMPETILKDAQDREDAIRLLALHGYIR